MVYAKIRGPEEPVLNKLKTLPQVTEVTVVQRAGDSLNKYEIAIPEDIDINEPIFHLVKDNGWVLAELYCERATLEDVFLKLTATGK